MCTRFFNFGEESFSASGQIMRPQRARLSSEMFEILKYLKCNCNFLKNKKIDSTWCHRFIFKRPNGCQSRSWSRLLLISVSNQRSRKTAGLGLEAGGLDYNTGNNHYKVTSCGIQVFCQQVFISKVTFLVCSESTDRSSMNSSTALLDDVIIFHKTLILNQCEKIHFCFTEN